MQLFVGISELYTPQQRWVHAVLAVQNGQVVWLGPAANLPPQLAHWPRYDLGGRGVVPGLVDAHTHLVYGGNRLDEYLLRAQGQSYEAILAAGGGIYSTVRATQAASDEQLLTAALERARWLLGQGVTALEIKSGYGLEPADELRMLRVIAALQDHTPQWITSTLLAHVIPQGWTRDNYVQTFCQELIPQVARSGLAQAVDVFCDQGAFTVSEAQHILQSALEQGLAIKLHAEQIAHTGATALAAQLGALSADHLEQSTPQDWQALARSGTVGMVLPGAAVVLRKPFPPAKAMWQAGVKVAIASDHNPGSSPLYSPWLAMQLTMALGGLSAQEALQAHTAHAADALGQKQKGRLETGGPADFVVIDSPHALEGLYRWGHSPIYQVYIAGQAQLS